MPESQVQELALQSSTPWSKFILYCKSLGHGEIHNLKIRDGVPVIAEQVIKKVVFDMK